MDLIVAKGPEAHLVDQKRVSGVLFGVPVESGLVAGELVLPREVEGELIVIIQLAGWFTNVDSGEARFACGRCPAHHEVVPYDPARGAQPVGAHLATGNLVAPEDRGVRTPNPNGSKGASRWNRRGIQHEPQKDHWRRRVIGVDTHHAVRFRCPAAVTT